MQIDFHLGTGANAYIFQKTWPEIAPYILLIAKKREVCPSLCELANGMYINNFLGANILAQNLLHLNNFVEIRTFDCLCFNVHVYTNIKNFYLHMQL